MHLDSVLKARKPRVHGRFHVKAFRLMMFAFNFNLLIFHLYKPIVMSASYFFSLRYLFHLIFLFLINSYVCPNTKHQKTKTKKKKTINAFSNTTLLCPSYFFAPQKFITSWSSFNVPFIEQ